MTADDPFHYPPELLSLLIDTIPLLCRSKQDVLTFFQGSGVPANLMTDLRAELAASPKEISKYRMARTVLTRLNEQGDRCLRPRREVLRRVTEFEDFSVCWPKDQFNAKGRVAEIRRVVNVKDSFTRMRQERDAERQRHLAQRQAELAAARQRRERLDVLRRDLAGLFAERNPQRRGKALESVLNRLFEAEGILVREAFTITGDQGEGVVEQIDGVIELDGELYLVEVKWLSEPLGTLATAQHLVRVFTRGDVRGLLVSASGFTAPAIAGHRDALAQKVVVLCELRELVLLLEQQGDLKGLLLEKVRAAVVDRNPYHRQAPGG